MNTCPNCGEKITYGAKFCTKCGTPANMNAGSGKAEQVTGNRKSYRIADFEDESIPGSNSALIGLCLCIASLFLGGIAPVSFAFAVICIMSARARGFRSPWLKVAIIIGLLGAFKGFFDFLEFAMPYR